MSTKPGVTSTRRRELPYPGVTTGPAHASPIRLTTLRAGPLPARDFFQIISPPTPPPSPFERVYPSGAPASPPHDGICHRGDTKGAGRQASDAHRRLGR